MSYPLKHARTARMALAFVTGLTVALGAQSQSTGNPKWTVSPSDTTAPKAGAAARPGQPNMSGAGGGKLVGDEAQARARMQSGKTPGSGTEGGLSTGQGSATGEPASRSNKGSAHARPVPPAR